MTDRVWLVRHASTDWSGERWCGWTDLALSATGVAAAQALATRLARELPEEVDLVSSPARRALETAGWLSRALALRTGAEGRADPEVDAGLREVDFGRADGCTWADLERDLPELAAALAAGTTNVDWPGGETAEAVRRRAMAAWERLVQRDCPVVAVCHGGVIRAVLDALALSTGWAIPPASVVEFRRSDGTWVAAQAGDPQRARPR
jgi:broad specificity phosphatase PhoE